MTADTGTPGRLSADQQRILDELVPFVRVGGLAIVIGAAGVGKTVLTRALVAGLSDTIVAHLVGPRTRSEFVTALAEAWNIETVGGVLRGLDAVLDEAAKTCRPVALVVDDAQALDVETFTELSALIALIEFRALQFPTRLSVVLVGDRRLDLALATFASQFASRVALRCDLDPLTFDEIAEYLLGKLRASGCQTSILTPRVLAIIAAETQGLPRYVRAFSDGLVQEHRRGVPLHGAAIQKHLVAFDGPPSPRAPVPHPVSAERVGSDGPPPLRGVPLSLAVERTKPREQVGSRRLRNSGAVAATLAGVALVALASWQSPIVTEPVTTATPSASATVTTPPSAPPIRRPAPTPPPPVETTQRPVEPAAPPTTVAPPPSPAKAPASASPRRADRGAPEPRVETPPAPRVDVRTPLPPVNSTRVDVSGAAAPPRTPASPQEVRESRPSAPQQSDRADDSDRVIDWLLQNKR